MINNQAGSKICLKKKTDLAYSAPTLTILGNAEELTKGKESSDSLDCSRPGQKGPDDSCS